MKLVCQWNAQKVSQRAVAKRLGMRLEREYGKNERFLLPLVHSGKVFDLKSFYIRSSVNGRRTDGMLMTAKF